MIDSKLFMDSSAWLAYFLENSITVRTFIDAERLVFTSVLSLFEIKRKLLRDQYSDKKMKKNSFFY